MTEKNRVHHPVHLFGFEKATNLSGVWNVKLQPKNHP